jgi:metal-sulfur cluster biosynthetic enzyme
MPTNSRIYEQLAKQSQEMAIAVLGITKKVDLENTAVATAIIAGAMTIAGSAIHSWEVSQGLINSLPANIGEGGKSITNMVTYVQEKLLTHESVGHNIVDLGLIGIVTVPAAAAINNIAVNLTSMLPTIKSHRINEMSKRMVEYVKTTDPINKNQTKDAFFKSLVQMEKRMKDKGLTEEDTYTVLNKAYRDMAP